MRNNVYGLSALMEAVEASNREENTLTEISDAVIESASFLDVGEDFVGTSQVEQDMDAEEDYISPEEDEKLEKILDELTEDDEVSEDALESLDAAIESFIGV